MLKMLILVCAAGLSPAECQIETASDVISGPVVSSVMACGLGGQSLVAETAAIGRHPGGYIKIRCTPLDRNASAGNRLREASIK